MSAFFRDMQMQNAYDFIKKIYQSTSLSKKLNLMAALGGIFVADLVHGNILLGVSRRAVAVVGLRVKRKVGGSLD
jgi:hypothetical protein